MAWNNEELTSINCSLRLLGNGDMQKGKALLNELAVYVNKERQSREGQTVCEIELQNIIQDKYDDWWAENLDLETSDIVIRESMLRLMASLVLLQAGEFSESKDENYGVWRGGDGRLEKE